MIFVPRCASTTLDDRQKRRYMAQMDLWPKEREARRKLVTDLVIRGIEIVLAGLTIYALFGVFQAIRAILETML